MPRWPGGFPHAFPFRRAVVATTLASILVAFAVLPAYANPFGFTGTIEVPENYAANNGLHEVYFSTSLDADLATGTQWAMDNSYSSHPDLTIYRTWTVSWYNDVRVYDGNYGSGWYGAAPCPAYAVTGGGTGIGRWCKPREVLYNRGDYPISFDTRPRDGTMPAMNSDTHSASTTTRPTVWRTPAPPPTSGATTTTT